MGDLTVTHLIEKVDTLRAASIVAPPCASVRRRLKASSTSGTLSARMVSVMLTRLTPMDSTTDPSRGEISANVSPTPTREKKT